MALYSENSQGTRILSDMCACEGGRRVKRDLGVFVCMGVDIWLCVSVRVFVCLCLCLCACVRAWTGDIF